MATNAPIFNVTNISADTGELGATGLTLAPPLPAIGTVERIVNMRMRLKTNVSSGVGQYLCSVRWNDGVSDQSWDVSLSVTPGNYTEVGQQIWCDASRNVTVQVSPLVAGGSIDVRIMGEF